MAVLSSAFEKLGISIAPPLDAAANADYDLMNACFVALIVGVLASGIVDLVHLGPPCSTFSVALNACAKTRLRTWDEPGGISGLNARQKHQVALGNALAEAAATIAKVQHKAANLYELEQPALAIMVAYGPCKTH